MEPRACEMTHNVRIKSRLIGSGDQDKRGTLSFPVIAFLGYATVEVTEDRRSVIECTGVSGSGPDISETQSPGVDGGSIVAILNLDPHPNHANHVPNETKTQRQTIKTIQTT